MRKFILLAATAAMIVPTAAIAQNRDVRHDRTSRTDHTDRTDRAGRTDRTDRTEVRHDQRDLRQDRTGMRHDRRNGGHTHAAYVAPYHNWSYRPVNVGYRLQPAFYGSRYYISDYGAYNLQVPHSRSLRWICYGEDLLLVNVRTGRVLQVVHNRNW